jgi:hypothetical protein
MGRDVSGHAQDHFYLQKAKECVKPAEEARDPLLMVSWLGLADRWLRIAFAEDQTVAEQEFDRIVASKGTGQTISIAEH